MKIKSQIPLFDAVFNHAKKNVISFHTPGHKNGEGIHKKLKSFTGKKVYSFDVTVFPEVDSLHDPIGPIKKAQEFMAKTYKVKHSFFLVNGSTTGNIAMFLSACNPGDTVILSRNCHKSVLSGIILSGIWPIWIQPTIDKELDIMFEPTPEEIEEMIKRFPEATAVFITSPTYTGLVPDLIKITEICHKYGKILMVDEAHGPHLKFHKDLPISAVECGADLCVQSTHKILSALSQGAVLHFNSDIIDINRVKKIVSALQTTSPNYLILASIDLARFQATLEAEKKFDKIIKWCQQARKEINTSNSVRCLTKEDAQKRNFELDLTKLTINVSKTQLTGQEVERELANNYNIQVDCADMFNIIAITGIGTQKGDVEALVSAIKKISENNTNGNEKKWNLELPELSSEVAMLPRDVFFSTQTKRVSLKNAAGHISAQILTPYPPGVPILTPGERISKDVCEYLMGLSEVAVRVSGQETDTLRTIKVIST